MSKQKESLETIYALVLGLVVLAVVWIGIDTFYPKAEINYYSYDHSYYETRAMISSVIALVSSAVLTIIALNFSSKLKIISNGLMLGGFFTLLYGIGVGIMSGNEIVRFIVVLLSLGLILFVGYKKYSSSNESVDESQENIERQE